MHAKLAHILSVPVIKQRSPEWFAARTQRVTASEAASIIGECKYSSRTQTLFKKFDLGPKFTSNPATEWGTAWEDTAIALYCAATGRVQNEVGLVSYEEIHGPNEDMKFLAGSADGIASCGEEEPILLEFKCPYRRKIIPGVIPAHYVAQVQLNLLIYNLSKADFVEFTPDPFNMNIVRIHRDDEYLDRIVPILRDFHNEVTEYRAKGIETHPKYKVYRRRG